MTQFAMVPGGRLAYDLAGAGDPPMIFVHGWCCDRSHFAPQVTHFSAGHAVATVDLRGHGESSAPGPAPGAYDIAVLADDVLAVDGRPGQPGSSAGNVRRSVPDRRSGQFASPAHPGDRGLGVIAELLCHPLGAPERAEHIHGRGDGLPGLPGAGPVAAL